MLKHPHFAALMLGALLLSAGVQAQPTAETDPLARSLVERLRPGGSLTRGVRIPGAESGPAASPATTQDTAIPAPAPAERPRDTTAPAGIPAVSMMVNFRLGSADLTKDAMAQLNSLGLALRELGQYRFRLEGHTDTVGDAKLNQVLSLRRAEAVRQYLIRTHGIAPSRLEAAGFGSSMLLVPTADQVDEPRNRRVQVLNIGG